ncbi:MAG: metal-dependent transcriptional regulator [Clostridia bacterium]|nr:metal-dependent transcriptional regulator [Clostridia bacterium]
MKLTSSQEEYLKTIYLLEKSGRKVRVTDIALKLKITKPSVNKAINLLKDMELIHYKAYGNITLTKEGKNYAIEVIKKQDILKMFLVEILSIEKQQAEEEAIAMKHAISEQTAKKLNQYITQIMNLGDLNCDYDESNEKCKNCIKRKAQNRLRMKEESI